MRMDEPRSATPNLQGGTAAAGTAAKATARGGHNLQYLHHVEAARAKSDSKQPCSANSTPHSQGKLVQHQRSAKCSQIWGHTSTTPDQTQLLQTVFVVIHPAAYMTRCHAPTDLTWSNFQSLHP